MMQDWSVRFSNLYGVNLSKVGGVMGATPYKVWEVLSHKVLK